MTDYLDLDVRPILRGGGEPFAVIMRRWRAWKRGAGSASTRRSSRSLFAVMAEKGFAHSDRALDGEDWCCSRLRRPKPETTSFDANNSPFGPWPEPVVELDNRDLDPPEAMVRILAAAERLRTGETLSSLLQREPVFLLPQFETRGFRWLGGFHHDGATYELTVRAPS